MKISKKLKSKINDVNVVSQVVSNPEKCGDVTRVCDPENYFDMIEQCKICGRCI